MSKVRLAAFFAFRGWFRRRAGAGTTDPLGKRETEMFEWFFRTRTFRAMIGKDGGSEGIDEDYAARGMANFSAFLLGRNMFGPIRGDWPDDACKGWWGPNPPSFEEDIELSMRT